MNTTNNMRSSTLPTRFFSYFALFFLISLYIFSSPTRIMLLTLLFSALHEAGHIICAWALGRRVKILRFTFFGLRPDLSQGCALSCLAIYISGVAVNLVLSLAAIIALHSGYNDLLFDCFIVNSLLFLYNIIPVPYSDGDGILRSALSLLPCAGAHRHVCNAVNMLFSFALFLFFSFRLLTLGQGLFSFFCSFVLLLTSLSSIAKG